jgi:hypothetical protein
MYSFGYIGQERLLIKAIHKFVKICPQQEWVKAYSETVIARARWRITKERKTQDFFKQDCERGIHELLCVMTLLSFLQARKHEEL